MGLDMYLTQRVYVKNWEHMEEKQKNKITIRRGGKIRKDINTKAIEELVLSVGYWRKANAIHAWFVQNVQDGHDDCREYYVSIENMETLRDICRGIIEHCSLTPGKVQNGFTYEKCPETGKFLQTPIIEDGMVMTNPEYASNVLPCQDGFFFGSTDYDQWYYEEIKSTWIILTNALASQVAGSFYYNSSW